MILCVRAARKCFFLLPAEKAINVSLRQLWLTQSWESGSPFSLFSAWESKASYSSPIHSSAYPLSYPSVHLSTHPLIYQSVHPAIPMLTNICNVLGIVLVTENISLALLHFSHELLQTSVLLQGICHLLGSHRPDGVLLQAVGEERGPSARLVTTIPKPRIL